MLCLWGVEVLLKGSRHGDVEELHSVLSLLICFKYVLWSLSYLSSIKAEKLELFPVCRFHKTAKEEVALG